MLKILLAGFIFLLGCTTDHSIKPMDINAEESSLNQKLPKQCGFEMLYYGKVTYRKDSKTYYFTVKDRSMQDFSEEFVLDQLASPEIADKYILFYGSPLVGGNVVIIEGEVLQIVDHHIIDFDKLKAWCALQPNSSEEPKVPVYAAF